MNNELPDVIYLQYYGSDFYIDSVEEPEPAEGDEVTWCIDKINDVDIRYLRATPEREAAPAMCEKAARLVYVLREYDADDNDRTWQKVANALRDIQAALELATALDGEKE